MIMGPVTVLPLHSLLILTYMVVSRNRFNALEAVVTILGDAGPPIDYLVATVSMLWRQL